MEIRTKNQLAHIVCISVLPNFKDLLVQHCKENRPGVDYERFGYANKFHTKSKYNSDNSIGYDVLFLFRDKGDQKKYCEIPFDLNLFESKFNYLLENV